LGAKFAPLAVPISRRKQAMACATVVYFPMLLLIVYSWSLARLRLSWPLWLLYPLYSRLVDKEILSVAAWLSFRKNWLLQGCAAYFPATLFKADPTLTWDPNKAYLIGYHPHGVCGCGAALAFGTDVLGWREKFPGLEVRLATILMSWRLPLLWELLARLGCIPGDGTTLARAVRPGRAVVMNVGGRDESLDASTGQHVLTVRPKREFFRLALRNGALLVPSFGFGESELFQSARDVPGLAGPLQAWIEGIVGASVPLFNGRSPFTYNLGPMPFRKPISVVVGTPLVPQQCHGMEPSDTQVEDLQERYVGALRALYERWKPHCELDQGKRLIIV